MSAWQPIDTAPQDGTVILVTYAYRGQRRVTLAWWSNDVQIMDNKRDTMVSESGWMTTEVDDPFYNEMLRGDCAPIKWKPMPEPASD